MGADLAPPLEGAGVVAGLPGAPGAAVPAGAVAGAGAAGFCVAVGCACKIGASVLTGACGVKSSGCLGNVVSVPDAAFGVGDVSEPGAGNAGRPTGTGLPSLPISGAVSGISTFGPSVTAMTGSRYSQITIRLRRDAS